MSYFQSKPRLTRLALGDLVTNTDPGNPLRSGGEGYACAIVACVEPFKLVSPASDMLWSSRDPEEHHVIGTCAPDRYNHAQNRLDPELQTRMPQGESLLCNQLGNGLTLIALSIEPIALNLNKESTSYGWAFYFNPDTNLWHAKHELSEEQLIKYSAMAADGVVMHGRDAFFCLSKDRAAEAVPLLDKELAGLKEQVTAA